MSTPTTQASNNTHTALFLAPETHQRAVTEQERFSLRVLRTGIGSMNSARDEFCRRPFFEFVQVNVRLGLQPYIDAVEAMLLGVSGRFLMDIAYADTSMARTRKVIEQWERCAG